MDVSVLLSGKSSESMKNKTFIEERGKCLMIIYLQMRSDSCNISVSQIIRERQITNLV